MAAQGSVNYYRAGPASRDERRRLPRAVTILAGLMLTFVFVGIASATGIYYLLNTSARELGRGADKQQDIASFEQADAKTKAPPLPDQPVTILLLGSDKREADPGDVGRSDTMMLVRMDPDRDTISTLSFPRDLRVEIPAIPNTPCPCVDKLNAAYAIASVGGVRRTLEELTGQRIDHFFNIDFKGFVQLVDTVGGVWVDVDRRYFNDNSVGQTGYDSIDLRPGYRLLRGNAALDYVRYRHTDSDFARIARQQSFQAQLKRAAESQIGKITRLLNAVTKNAASDIDNGIELAELANLAITVPKERTFRYYIDGQAVQDGEVSYVIADETEIQAKVAEWLEPQQLREDESIGATAPAPAAPPQAPPTPPEQVVVRILNGNGAPGEAQLAVNALKAAGYARSSNAGNAENFSFATPVVRFAPGRDREARALAARLDGARTEPFTPRPGDPGKAQRGADLVVVTGVPTFTALAPPPAEGGIVRSSDPNAVVDVIDEPDLDAEQYAAAQDEVRFPLMMPSVFPKNAEYVDAFDTPAVAAYDMGFDHGMAVKSVMRVKEGFAGFFGLMQSTWKGAPILSGETLKKTYKNWRGDPVDLRLYYDGKTLKMVAWTSGKGVYWLTNTLDPSVSLSSAEMVCMARSMRPITAAAPKQPFGCRGRGLA